MNLFEWFAEKFNPGPIGGVDGPEPILPAGISRILSLLICLAGLALFFASLRWIGKTEDIVYWKWYLSFFIYLAFSWGCTPKPDATNLGWFGGLMNNPFRISDNLNRMLAFAYLLLLPGKLMVYGILYPIQLFKSAQNQ